MKKRNMIRNLTVTAAMTALLTGAFAGQAFAAANDDMDAVSLAKKMIGFDYSKDDESPTDGFDSSGLMYYVYDTLNYNMPRGLEAQYKMNKPLIKSLSSVQEGDMLFFGKGSSLAYTGIYIGGDKMIFASKGREGVVEQKLTSDFQKDFIGARRVLSKDDQLRVKLVLTARQYLGTPYVFGAKYGQTKTFDCSSFMKTIFAKYGFELPRKSIDQSKEGKFVSRANLQTGDLVFFTTKDSKGKVGHVGMYVGNGQMIHTYGEGGVKYGTIKQGWWDNHYVTARRIIN